MADNKLSVDDILDELEHNRTGGRQAAKPEDMERVDNIIRGILEKKQTVQPAADSTGLTPQEKRELEKEIKAQTRSLTRQMEKVQKEKEAERKKKAEEFTLRLSGTLVGDDAPPAIKEPPEIKLNKLAKEQQIRVRHTEEILPEREELLRKKYDGLKKVANSQHIRSQMKDITDHFGNYKMEDDSVEDSYSRISISPSSYKALKHSRNKRIESFMKESSIETAAHGQHPENAAGGEPAAEVQLPSRVIDIPLEDAPEDSPFGYEYTDYAQSGKIRSDLEKKVGRIKLRLTLMGAVLINTLLLACSGTGEASIMLFGLLPVAPLLFALLNAILLGGALAISGGLFRELSEAFQNRRASKNLLFLLTALVCLGVNLTLCIKPELLLQPTVHLYTPIAVGGLLFAMIAQYQQALLAQKNFAFSSSGEEKFAMLRVTDDQAARDFTKGMLGEPELVKNVSADFLDGFLTQSFRPDRSDKVCKRIACFALPASILLAVGGFLMTKDAGVAFTLLSGGMAVCSAFVGAMAVSLPYYDSSAFIRRTAGMMPAAGTEGELENANAILLDGYDLFPEDAVLMHGIKTFQGKRVDDAIIDAASVVTSARSVLEKVFLGIIGNNLSLLRKVDSLQYEDGMGISAWVDERRVLIGNRELMVNHSVAVPPKGYEEKYNLDGCEVVYLSTRGELCAAFIVEFVPGRTIVDAVRLLERYSLLAVVRSVDACLTAELLQRVFDVDVSHFRILPALLHAEFERQHQPVERLDAALGNNGAPLGSVVLLALQKKLGRCCRMGTGLALVSSILGLLLLGGALAANLLSIAGCWTVLLYLGLFMGGYWLYEHNLRL